MASERDGGLTLYQLRLLMLKPAIDQPSLGHLWISEDLKGDVRGKEHPTDAMPKGRDAGRDDNSSSHNRFRRFFRHPKCKHILVKHVDVGRHNVQDRSAMVRAQRLPFFFHPSCGSFIEDVSRMMSHDAHPSRPFVRGAIAGAC